MQHIYIYIYIYVVARCMSTNDPPIQKWPSLSAGQVPACSGAAWDPNLTMHRWHRDIACWEWAPWAPMVGEAAGSLAQHAGINDLAAVFPWLLENNSPTRAKSFGASPESTDVLTKNSMSNSNSCISETILPGNLHFRNHPNHSMCAEKSEKTVLRLHCCQVLSCTSAFHGAQPRTRLAGLAPCIAGNSWRLISYQSSIKNDSWLVMPSIHS